MLRPAGHGGHWFSTRALFRRPTLQEHGAQNLVWNSQSACESSQLMPIWPLFICTTVPHS
jgi:hypothetical protein